MKRNEFMEVWKSQGWDRAMWELINEDDTEVYKYIRYKRDLIEDMQEFIEDEAWSLVSTYANTFKWCEGANYFMLGHVNNTLSPIYEPCVIGDYLPDEIEMALEY